MSSPIYEKTIEAILFAAGEPVGLSDIADALETDKASAENSVMSLARKYSETNAGIQILEVDGCYQMHTNPAYFATIQKLFQKPRKKALTPTLMETLAIIAFKQPISRPQIEEIRGVSADHAVTRLLEFNLIEEAGRLEIPGRPVAFGTTVEFLRHFGFKSIQELSDFKKENDADDEQIVLEDEKDTDNEQITLEGNEICQ